MVDYGFNNANSRIERSIRELEGSGIVKEMKQRYSWEDGEIIQFVVNMDGVRYSMPSSIRFDFGGNPVGGKIRYGAIPVEVKDKQSVSFSMRQVQKDTGVTEDEVSVRVWVWDSDVVREEGSKGVSLPHHDIQEVSLNSLINLVEKELEMFKSEYEPITPDWVNKMSEF